MTPTARRKRKPEVHQKSCSQPHQKARSCSPLPPKCPELNPQENVWQFIRDDWLSNRVFDGIDALIDHCCDAWNKLEAQPWTIMSIGLCNWAHRF